MISLHPVGLIFLGIIAVLSLGAAVPALATTVTPHVFDGGVTLVDIAQEGLEPWGFYDGTKGMAVPEVSASGDELTRSVGTPMAANWIAASGWSAPAGDNPSGFPAPVPNTFGRSTPGPCFWKNSGYSKVETRNRCGYPVPPVMALVPGGGGPFTHTPLYPFPSGGSQPNKPATPVPLPAAGWLLLAGIAGLGWRSRRR